MSKEKHKAEKRKETFRIPLAFDKIIRKYFEDGNIERFKRNFGRLIKYLIQKDSKGAPIILELVESTIPVFYAEEDGGRVQNVLLVIKHFREQKNLDWDGMITIASSHR